MDQRSAKLALARQKLKNHQEKKLVLVPKDDAFEEQNQENNQQFQHGLTTLCESARHESEEKEPKNIPQKEHEEDVIPKVDEHNFRESEINVTELLITSKRKLELQMSELKSRLSQLENNYTLAVNDNTFCKQQISNLNDELQALQEKYKISSEENTFKEKIINELRYSNSTIIDENNNLQELLEFTKNMLTAKESENTSLKNQLTNLQNQLEAMQVKLEQMTGSQSLPSNQTKNDVPDHNPDILLQKIAMMEQHLKTVQKERDQINSHCEQYVGELNEQLKLNMAKNNELSTKVEQLSIRENSLIDQISEMEIRIQNMRQHQQPEENNQVVNQDMQPKHDAELRVLQEKYENLEAQLHDLATKHDELQRKYIESVAKVQELSEAKEAECDHDNISLSKLQADIASDKLAAQRATEQNKKLKNDLHELEDAFVKISKDKLELTEKVAAEKFLNRELTIKLAEVEERAKAMHTTLLAKDEEMIRLQNSYRIIERELENLSEYKEAEKSSMESGENVKCEHKTVDNKTDSCKSHAGKEEHQCFVEGKENRVNSTIPNADAMEKLQNRFMKIMDEVANLSDEKHRLEHIILQLQNETDTICEYVALYQQQRNLLKKRDEERSAQIKIFRAECELLKTQLEELSGIIIRLALDTELEVYFKTEPRKSHLAKVLSLLSFLKSNTLIDPNKTSSELENFYPCSCCSGQLIEV